MIAAAPHWRRPSDCTASRTATTFRPRSSFTLRMNLRRGVPLFTIAGAIGTGIVLYFVSDVVFALGASSSIPVVLAAWSPAGISLLLGVTVLLYTEEG